VIEQIYSFSFTTSVEASVFNENTFNNSQKFIDYLMIQNIGGKMENIGHDFIRLTSYTRGMDSVNEINEQGAPEPKTSGNIVMLPKPQTDSDLSVLITSRRSKRAFDDSEMPFDDLSKILFLTQGVTKTAGDRQFRAVASAGNGHPFNNYILVNRVKGLRNGLYFYNHSSHSLDLMKDGELSEELTKACLGQKMINTCQVVYIQTAVTSRTTSRYNERGYRYIFLDAGHIGAQTQLVCQELGYGSCNIGAFLDDEVADFLGVKPPHEIPVYMTVIGKPV